MNAKPAIRNKTWAELKVGDAASLERSYSVQNLCLFAYASGNVNPLMLPSADNDRARLASCALAQPYEFWRREGRAFGDQETVAKAAE